jgi:hypothetical protein
MRDGGSFLVKYNRLISKSIETNKFKNTKQLQQQEKNAISRLLFFLFAEWALFFFHLIGIVSIQSI